MTITETQKTAQLAADAAVSAAEAKQYMLEAEQGYQDTSAAAQQAQDAAGSALLSKQSAATSEENSLQYATEAGVARDEAVTAASNASEYALNKFTFYKTPSDPDGTIAGLAATTDGQSFWVAQGPDALSAAWQYQNKAGVAVLQAKQPGTAAITGTIREFPTLAAAQADADAGNIPVGSTAYYRNADDTVLAIEVINNSGALEPTGRKMPSQFYYSQSDSGNLYDFYDKNQQLIGFIDSAGQLFLHDMDDKPVQQIKADVDDINTRVVRDGAPSILRLSNEQNATLGIVDAMGEHYIPGLGDESLQKYITRTRDDVDVLYRSRQVFNAVTDFGINNSGLVDCSAQIQTAFNFLSKLPFGGSIYFPDGVYRLHTEVVPRDNVTITMAPGRARFLPVGRHGAITKRGLGKGYLKNARFIDVEIDGAEQSLYGFMVKGFYLQYFEDTLLLRCNVHDIGASGIGIDFPSNSFILDCVTKNCGRLASLGNAGSSGIGIGTGARQDESLIISRSINTGNKNFGIFFEQQTDSDTIYQSRQIIVSDSIMTGNGWGFGDCGISGVILNGCQINDNLHEGVLIDSGTLTVNANRPQSGNYGIVSNCQIQRNGSHGVNYSSMKSLGGGGYTFSTNKVMANQGNGVNIEAKAEYSLPDMMITQNDIIDSTGDAVQIKSGTCTDIDITGNRMLRNGGNINVTGNIDTGSITGNKLRSRNGAHAIEGAGNLTDIYIAENQYTDTNDTPVNLTGTHTNVTYGRNPGF
ncbi:right-handed parallel beta-helix repeat-containing protein [Pluralibacter gergoviae]|nr:right-handed parallel beta-helix repeat-containing protein [Pluralibacter gergoviae]